MWDTHRTELIVFCTRPHEGILLVLFAGSTTWTSSLLLFRAPFNNRGEISILPNIYSTKQKLVFLKTFEITDTSLLNQGHLSHLSLNEGISSIFDTPFILECRWPLSSTRLWQRLMLNHLKFKWRGQDQLFPSPSSFSSTDLISSLLLVEIMGTISGTTSPDSILSANRPCS